jgi:hypothetical protein
MSNAVDSANEANEALKKILYTSLEPNDLSYRDEVRLCEAILHNDLHVMWDVLDDAIERARVSLVRSRLQEVAWKFDVREPEGKLYPELVEVRMKLDLIPRTLDRNVRVALIIGDEEAQAALGPQSFSAIEANMPGGRGSYVALLDTQKVLECTFSSNLQFGVSEVVLEPGAWVTKYNVVDGACSVLKRTENRVRVTFVPFVDDRELDTSIQRVYGSSCTIRNWNGVVRAVEKEEVV